MEAVILAGGEMPAALQGLTSATERALTPVAGAPILLRVVESLATATPVTGIICVTTPGALAILPTVIGEVSVRGLPSGDKLSHNLMLGARAATSDQILIVTGDGPLATGRTWMQFLDGAAVNLLEAAYAVVREEKMEAQFPGARRTYARFNDGAFSGGNAFLVPRARLEALEELIETAFAARKNPLGLAKLLGLGFIFKAVMGRLPVSEAEAKVSRLLGCRAGRVEVPDATIAFDVDKPEDLALAEKWLRQNRSGPGTTPNGATVV